MMGIARHTLFCMGLACVSANLWSQQLPTLEKIVVYGNVKTRSPVLLRELNIREGSPFTEDRIREERAWFLRQDLFKRIEFQLKAGSAQDRRILMLIVQEKGTWSFSPILSNQDVYGWYAGGKVAATNMWGSRNRIETTIQLGGYRQYALAWSNPWILGKLRMFADLVFYHTAFRYRFQDHPASFEETDTGMTLSLGKSFGRRFQLGMRLGWEEVYVGDPSVTVTGGNTDRIHILEPFVRYDSRDWPLYPRKGIYLHSSYRLYSVQNQQRFYRFFVDGRLFTPTYRENILAIQVSAELSMEAIPVYKRIHIGGGRTIRGFSAGDLSGENSLLVSAEYRIPIFYIRNPLAGVHVGYAAVLFSDIAAAWYQSENLSSDMVHGAYGVGIHIIWDHWVLRFEYGYRGAGWGFINVGSGIKF